MSKTLPTQRRQDEVELFPRSADMLKVELFPRSADMLKVELFPRSVEERPFRAAKSPKLFAL
jgi:hypothetical protein